MKRPPPKISLLLADVDGTLVTHAKVLTDRTKAAVAALKDAGVMFAVTSGRPPKGMAMLVGPLKLETPIAGFNGGAFVNPDFSPLDAHLLPGNVARAVFAMIKESGIDPWLYAGDEWLVHRLDAPHVAREEKTVQFKPTVMDDFGDRIDRAIKIVGVSDDAEKLGRCARAVHDRFGTAVTSALSQPYYLDVTHPHANKGDVVVALSKRLGVPVGEIATIGDMPNDVDMFKRSGFAIAMGNASPEVKDEADALTGDCDHEGFAQAVETFILKKGARR